MAQTVEDLERQIEQLKNRKKALIQKESQKNRKRRNHALMTLGALVESTFDNGWTEIGAGRFAAYLKRHRDEILAACRVENVEPEEAEKRLREWERSGRKSASEKETEKLQRKVLETIPASEAEEAAEMRELSGKLWGVEDGD